MAKAIKDVLGKEMCDLLDSNPDKFNEAFKPLMAIQKIKWFFEDAIWKLNVKTPAEVVKAFEAYALEGVADKIVCHMAIVKAKGDIFTIDQPGILYEHLKCPKTLIEFTADDAAETHCQAGAVAVMAQKLLDWLDQVI